MSASKFGTRLMCGFCLPIVALSFVASGAYVILKLIAKTASSSPGQSKVVACFNIFFLIVAAFCLLYCAAGIFLAIFLSSRDCAQDVMALLFTKNKIAPSPTTTVQGTPPPPDHHLPVILFTTMDITHNVRTCTANLNCDCVPTVLLLGVNGVREARDSQNCAQNCGTALKLSHRRGSSFPDEILGKLYRISSENATEAGTPDEHLLQNENSEAAGTSQTESTSNSVAAKAKRSNSLKVRSDFAGKLGHAQPYILTQKNKSSTKSVNNNGNPIRPVKRSGDKLPSASGQVLGVKAKTEPPKSSSKASSMAWHVKENKISKDPSKLTSNISSSDQVHRGQPGQNSICFTEAVKKSRHRAQAVKMSGTQIPSTPKQEKEMKEPSKGPSNFPAKVSSSVQARWCQPVQKSKCSAEAVKKSGNQTQVVKKSGDQIRPASKQEKKKGKTERSKLESNLSTKRMSSDQVHRGPNRKREGSAEAVENSKNQPEAVKKRTNQLSATPKQVWQVKIKTASSQDSGKTSSKVRQEKKKTSSTSHTKHRRRRQHQQSRSFSPEYYIMWDGFVKLGLGCFLCENDLAHWPLPTDEGLESDKLPDVAVLPCGHAFHTLCFEQAMPEELLKDPACFICASLQ
ncbi:unnamed protein product [Dovyalis caffra]|uniref:RING-type domain-containing protein n=1 Tax=Dovyalis caffra TaxID=77055 RepID=A0AAV1RQK1_9ROSI|nr:unnamed protein product [Dovyalis caffra]